MRFLIIGRGGLEHALVRALKFSPSVNEIHVAPGSAGISRDAICHALDLTDVRAVEVFVTKYRFDCVIVGSAEDAAAGLADQLRALNVPVVGSSRAAARRLRDAPVDLLAAAGVPFAPSADGELLSCVILTDGARTERWPLARIDANGADLVATAPALLAAEDSRDVVVRTIVTSIVSQLANEGLAFAGALAIDLTMTEAGPVVHAISAGFGDPSTQATLPLFAGDWGRTFVDLASGRLDELAWTKTHAACVVKTTKALGAAIEGDLGYQTHSSYFLHAGTAKSSAGPWTVSGPRVLNAIGLGSSATEALRAALAQASGVTWQGSAPRQTMMRDNPY